MPKIVDHQARRREIVEASWRVIAADGLAGVTMRKIADAAGCSTGRLTHYFANREEIVLAALRAVYHAARARLERVGSGASPAPEKLIAFLEETLPLDRVRLLEWKVWIAFWSAAAAAPLLALIAFALSLAFAIVAALTFGVRIEVEAAGQTQSVHCQAESRGLVDRVGVDGVAVLLHDETPAVCVRRTMHSD